MNHNMARAYLLAEVTTLRLVSPLMSRVLEALLIRQCTNRLVCTYEVHRLSI